MSNLYKIVHWFYPDHFATKEGFGIVVDPKTCGCAWDSLIIGYTNAKGEDRQREQEFHAWQSFDDFKRRDYIEDWHFERHPCKVMIEGIRYAVYYRYKVGMLDNLSLVEILDKLNGYNRRI
jgi:hypothetical protein